MGRLLIRLADILISASVLILLTPLWVVLIPVLRMTGEGDVFYRQERIGLGGRSFQLLKFATMKRNSSSIGPLLPCTLNSYRPGARCVKCAYLIFPVFTQSASRPTSL